MTVRVALCDDHAVVRAGLRMILSTEPDIEVVSESATVAQAVTAAELVRPDVFVMDVNLPDGSGLDAAQSITTASPGTRVVVLTVHDDVAYVRRAFEAGVSGYLLKEAADFELVTAIRDVAAGRRYVHPRLGAELLSAPRVGPGRIGGPGGELSERETEVLRLLARGYTNAQVADELIVSVRTVESHRAHIQQKLGVRNRADLIRTARDAGLLDN